MNIQDLGSIGELVAALATLLTLGYLAIQLKQNTSALKSQTFQQSSMDMSLTANSLSSDGELAKIIIKAENWDNSFENEIIIFGLDDLIIDGPQPVTFVTGDPVSNDPQYDNMNALDVADVSLLNEDNDKAALIISIPGKVSEDLTFTELTVSLATEISEDVFVDISLEDSTELSVNLDRIKFSPGDTDNVKKIIENVDWECCLLYTSPSPRD